MKKLINEVIPKEASVAASETICPHVSTRRSEVNSFFRISKPLDYIFTFGGMENKEFFNLYIKDNKHYDKIKEECGFVVYKRKEFDFIPPEINIDIFEFVILPKVNLLQDDTLSSLIKDNYLKNSKKEVYALKNKNNGKENPKIISLLKSIGYYYYYMSPFKLIDYNDEKPWLQNTKNFGDKWHYDVHLTFQPKKPSNFTIGLNVLEEGEYQMIFKFSTAFDYGTVDILLNNEPLITKLDLFSPSVTSMTNNVHFVKLKKGENQIKFDLNDKSPKSTGYFFGIDHITLIRYSDIKQTKINK
jgi:hypothetical protein